MIDAICSFAFSALLFLLGFLVIAAGIKGRR